MNFWLVLLTCFWIYSAYVWIDISISIYRAHKESKKEDKAIKLFEEHNNLGV
jgi:uncharacterized membrane protein YciS (DUF1049 family)